MIGFETLIPIIFSLFVGYITIIVTTIVTIMVARYKTDDQKEDSGKSKNKTIRIVVSVSVLFLLFLILAILLYRLDNTTVSHIIKTYIIQPIYQSIYWITPMRGEAFSWENFVICYYVGLGILCIETIFIANRYLNPNMSVYLRVLDMFLLVFFIIIVFSWVEYYISFSIYNVFIEFSFFHYFSANICANIIISGTVKFIMKNLRLKKEQH